jgi:hypothetical protein
MESDGVGRIVANGGVVCGWRKPWSGAFLLVLCSAERVDLVEESG